MEQPNAQPQQPQPMQGAESKPPVEGEAANNAEKSTQPQACRSETSCRSEASCRSDITCSSPGSEPQSLYHIKWVRWNNQKTPIITQNENGPCPLIAIINVLTLKGLIKLPHALDIITVEQLMEHLGDCILSSIPKDIPENAQLNYEQNMHDAIAILPKLQTGLDVNVRFTGVKDFEYTPECIVFDLLRIPLYHGWLLDPESPEVLAAVGNCSYNQLVERIINNKSSPQPEVVTEALIAETFLERTASQLTYHGLCELNTTLMEDELCVLFRNNHFITLHKRKDLMYQLVTDQGFLNEADVVWETLNNVEGDGQFADSNFVVKPPKPRSLTTEQQIDQDEELAKQLQEEENYRAGTRTSGQNPAQGSNVAAAAPASQQPRGGSQSPPSKKDCTIL